MNEMDISIIVPVYFNEGSIKQTYQVLKKEIFPNFPKLKFEIIFIDDGSKDNSYNEICEIRDNNEDIEVILFTRNFGQVAALYAGYKQAKGKGILNIAADLQEPPELIISIITNFINKEAEIIAGQRIDRVESFYRKKTSYIFYSLIRKLCFPNMPNGGFDVVLISNKVKDFIINSNESNPFWQGQILWTGFSVKFIPYTRKKRDIGKSKWTFTKKLKYLLDGLLNYSHAPLRFFSVIGIITFFLGIIYSIIIVINYLLGNSPFVGWAPIMIVVLLFSGLQLVMLGVIGEYLWRAFEQTKDRPKYIINKNG